MAVSVKPDGDFVVIYAGPWTGVNVQQPTNLIKDTDASFIADFTLRNCAITSRPQFRPALIAAPENFPILAIGTFKTVSQTVPLLWALDRNASFYTYDGATWTRQSSIAGTSTINVEWRVFNNVLYLCGTTSLNTWDGTTFNNTAAETTDGGASTIVLGASFIDELSQQLLLANTQEFVALVGTNFPTRIRWSAVGQPSMWDANVNQNAGFNTLIDVPDGITGLMMLGRVGYILRTNGITEMDPTGIGTAPFQFNHLWASQQGVGNIQFFVSAQYGLTGVIISTDNIYSLQSYQLAPIGGMTRDAIMRDLGNVSSFDVSAIPYGAIIPYFENGVLASGTAPNYGLGTPYTYLLYMLFIPLNINGVLSTRVWVYSFEDNNWSSFTIVGYQVTCRPSIGIIPNGGSNVFFVAVPVINTATGVNSIATFDPTNLNDPNQSSVITFKAEDIIPNAYPTVRRVVVVYTDLGVATLTCTVSAANDDGKVITASDTQTIGNTVPTGALLTRFFNLTVAGFRPQLTITRPANGGPVSISHVEMVGHVERVSL